MSKIWHLYLVRTSKGHLYTGITTDVARRFSEHCDGVRGAKALRGRGPLQLAFSIEVGSRTDAQRLEIAIKRWPKARKEQLVAGNLALELPAVTEK
ncbi:GIY-YIG nuclease family protein [Biformimicrobium ophioploci]|uniref:GIY-YIG nuclease family protein n=1 Tax=Biformimicrobium ophioploci TaxID=3036711 RepID=A0ABQ6M2H9_9GAMM|nr:GIY-YIG nuclease family protein [Microbulbifer sp. NKW57]GMG88532.1 GIY-YIG nuclease family protein [Microbulbifer sp. NKW57]